MKQGKLLILLLLVFSFSNFLHASAPGTPDRPDANNELTCPLPPPATVTVSNITGNSAQVSWTPVSGATWYKVRLENTFNPTYTNIQFTTSTALALTGLTENTDYTVYVSATSCGKQDNFGLERERPFSTPAIIIDDIVFLEQCTNYNISIPIPPTGIVVVNLDTNTSPQPTLYKQYLISKPKPGQPADSSVIRFGAWSYQPAQNEYEATFHQESMSSDLTRTPGNTTGPVQSISYKQQGAPADFVTLSAIGTSAGAPPQLRFTFAPGSPAAHLYVCGGRDNSGGGKGGGNFGSGTETEHIAPVKLSATPNPFTDQTTLHYSIGKDSPITLSLYNSTGTLVKTVLNKVWTVAGNQETMVEMSDLPNGLYFVTLETNEGRQVSTLVKTN